MEEVSYATCVEELLSRDGYYRAKSALDDWRARSGYSEVVDFVSSFTHRYLYTITSEQVLSVARNSAHALGDIRKEEQLDEIENFTTPFAFQHLFHWYLESHACVPDWRQFKDWVVYGEPGRYWYSLLREHLVRSNPSADSAARQRWSRAARWRLGKVYLSNMRELAFFASVREYGIPLKYHLLADVLFRVDFWLDNSLVCTYFPNSKYRSGSLGRKPLAASFFSGASPDFRIIDVEVQRQGFGRMWSVDQSAIVELSKKLASTK